MSSKTAQARHDAAVLPRIRDLVADDLSLREIAEQLEIDGFPPPRRGGNWNPTAVKRILDRAGPAASTTPTPSVHVEGEVNMTGPLTILASGPVHTSDTVIIATPETAAQAQEQSKSSPLIVPAPTTPYALTLGPAEALAAGIGVSSIPALVLPNPLFLRKRV